MRIVFSILFLVFSFNLLAQQDTTVRKDKSEVEVRKFDSEKLEDYKDQQWFDYEEPAKPVSGFWDWFWRMIGRMLGAIFSDKGATPFLRNGIALAILLIAAYFLFRKYTSGLFQNDSAESIEFQEISDDIYANDLDKLLEKAIQEQAYRYAVRILFLIFVKQLSEKKYIDWKLGKTNHHYWREIKQEDILTHFKELTLLYEYVWYGEFQVDGKKFKSIHENFNSAQTLL